ncbi:unnamed protein product [Prorocentrum cordatum]|uniref:Uncharacterized protein n=1 Tax=Prorocentrum cordatum TaxID=2364126 RepID=A0ABN9PHX6_9DINO|nr:unnamed protein product [Polarella glacialis]
MVDLTRHVLLDADVAVSSLHMFNADGLGTCSARTAARWGRQPHRRGQDRTAGPLGSATSCSSSASSGTCCPPGPAARRTRTSPGCRGRASDDREDDGEDPLRRCSGRRSTS